jgi:hypothetical protein
MREFCPGSALSGLFGSMLIFGVGKGGGFIRSSIGAFLTMARAGISLLFAPER